MRITIRLVGGREVLARLRAMPGRVDELLPVALEAAALPLENAWKDNVASYYTKAGEAGPGGKRGLVRTGNYLRSIHHQRVESAARPTVVVGTDIVDPPYPVYLELGTSRMSPKPTARPAFDEKRGEMAHEFGAAMRQLLGSIG